MPVLARIVSDPYIGGLVMRQSPQGAGRWGNVQFTVDEVEDPDYVVVIDHVRHDTVVQCKSDNIWCVVHEPPVRMFAWLHDAAPEYGKVFTTDPNRTSAQYVRMQTAIPWELDRTYDFLKSCPAPEKVKDLSWVTSNKGFMDGHKLRMQFLDSIRDEIEFDLWGNGFEFIKDKWDGIAPYKYSLAIENYSGPYYWSEKLGDCYLCYAMPIYYGCTAIDKYFPRESYIEIDITKPDEAIDTIRHAISSKLWEKNRDAIVYARELVLQKYQLIPQMAQLIDDSEARGGESEKVTVTLKIPDYFKRPILPIHIYNKLKRALKKRLGLPY